MRVKLYQHHINQTVEQLEGLKWPEIHALLDTCCPFAKAIEEEYGDCFIKGAQEIEIVGELYEAWPMAEFDEFIIKFDAALRNKVEGQAYEFPKPPDIEFRLGEIY